MEFYAGYVSLASGAFVRAVRGGLTSSSFVDNGDGTVTDTATGLMWQKATAPESYGWSQAKAYCRNLRLAGYWDWRLPTKNELQTLADYTGSAPFIDTEFFPDTAARRYRTSSYRHKYWDTSPYPTARYLDFSDGTAGTWLGQYGLSVRALRAGACGAGMCPAETLLGENAPELEALRDFRDSRLANSFIGRIIIETYYRNADRITAAIEASPALRIVAHTALAAIASLAGAER